MRYSIIIVAFMLPPSLLGLHMGVARRSTTARCEEHARAATIRCCNERPPRTPGIGGRVPQPSTAAADNYAQALAEAQLAAAKLEQAKQRLATERPPTRPRGARTTVSRSDAGTLLVSVPAAGLGGGTLMGGAFSVAWFSAIVPSTASMLATGGASALFMLPFWLAGGAVAKQTIVDPAKATALSIGEIGWELSQTAVGVRLSSADGPSEELDYADVDVAAYVNGIPTYVLRLVAGVNVYNVGTGLAEAELEWIATEINNHLGAMETQRSLTEKER